MELDEVVHVHGKSTEQRLPTALITAVIVTSKYGHLEICAQGLRTPHPGDMTPGTGI